MADEMTGADRCGTRAIEYRAERRANINRAESPFIIRDIRRQYRHQRIGGISVGVIQHDIDAAVDLGR